MDHTPSCPSVPTNQTSLEFSEGIEALRNHDDKIHVVLIKACQPETQQLMGEGCLWLLVKPMDTPKVVKVCINWF